jgi:hypothetical protein
MIIDNNHTEIKYQKHIIIDNCVLVFYLCMVVIYDNVFLVFYLCMVVIYDNVLWYFISV